MVTGTSNSPIDNLIKKNLKMSASTNDARKISLSEAYSKVSMRYLLQRSKRFDDNSNVSLKHEDRDNDVKKLKKFEDKDFSKERLIERLKYLGLAPRKYVVNECSSSSKRKQHSPKKLPQNLVNDDKFLRPQVLECDYCLKFFFNKTIYRRHVIKHLRIRRCTNCNQPFKDKISHRRHQSNCKQRFHYQKYARKMFEFSL